MSRAKTKKFKARNHSRLSDEQAQKYGERIDQLITLNGGKITPIDVVNDAKKRTSPLHEYFEWDDSKAAQEYRLQQARHMTASIVEVTIIDSVPKEHRSFVSITDVETKKPAYVTIVTAVTEQSYRQELIEKIIRHLQNTTQLLELFKSYEK